jgi:hypothetical protein
MQKRLDAREEHLEALRTILLSLQQLGPEGGNCKICGDNDHQAFECHLNIIVQARRGREKEQEWRCYHCNEVFNDSEAARKHFGNIPAATTRCINEKCLCLSCPANPIECGGKGEIKEEEFKRRFAAQMIMQKVEPKFARECADVCWDAREHLDMEESPEDLADTEMSYWND